MDVVAEKFFELLSVARKRSEPESLEGMTSQRWEVLLKFAGKQALSGVSFPALDMLPSEQKAPLKVYARWALLDEKIREHNEKQFDKCRELTRVFSDAGFRTCILKGQSLALYYPDPCSRQSGDIDIWVDAPMEKTLEFLKSRWKVGEVVYHHCEVQFFKDVEVEVHFKPSWFNSFIRDRKLQRYFKSFSDAQFSHFDKTAGFCRPTDEFNCVYLLVHILRHLLDEGVGFRQLMDYSLVLETACAQDRESAMKTIRELGIASFCAAVMYVIQIAFHTPEDNLLCRPDPEKGKILLNDIILSGNFGKSDKRNRHAVNENRVQRFARKFRRALNLSSILGSEAFCQPFFKLWQYLWRKRKGYL